MLASVEQNPPKTDDGRLHYLDGLRGWAALAVVVYHSTWELFGDYTPRVRIRALSLATDGDLAVGIFFVLSGVVLSRPYLRSCDTARVTRMAMARYVRLMIPVAGASTIALLMMMGGLLHNGQAISVVGRADWLGDRLMQIPSVLAWAKFSLYDVFFCYDMNRSYGPFLWTMPIELAGSYMLFSLFALFGRFWRARFLAYVVTFGLAWMLAQYLAAFVVGAIAAEYGQSHVQQMLRRHRVADVIGFLLLIAAAIASDMLRSTYSPHRIIALAAVVVGAVILSPALQAVLQTRVSRWLGRVSFPLYLVHAFVIYGPGCWLIVHLSMAGFSHQAVVAAVVPVTIVFSLCTAWLFLPVEEVAIRASHEFARLFAAGPTWPPAPPSMRNAVAARPNQN